MSDDIGTLKTASFELARSTKWARRPIDTANIQRLADRLYEIAKVKVETSSPLGVDIPMVTRAVNYLHQKTTILDDPAQSLRARARRRPCVSSHVDVPGSRHLGSIEYTASLGWRAPTQHPRPSQTAPDRSDTSFAGRAGLRCGHTRTGSEQRRFSVQREDGHSHRTKRVRPRSIRMRWTQLQQC
jgi:hypothetical protein